MLILIALLMSTEMSKQVLTKLGELQRLQRAHEQALETHNNRQAEAIRHAKVESQIEQTRVTLELSKKVIAQIKKVEAESDPVKKAEAKVELKRIHAEYLKASALPTEK